MSSTLIDACKALLIAMLAAHSFNAYAQDYPDRPIRFVIPYPPGGASDVTARILAPKLSDGLGQNLVIDNRGGANGIIGLSLVANARPDGYTILMGSIGTQALNASLYSKMPYDSAKDFTPIALAIEAESLLALHPSVAAGTPFELIALARAQRGKLTCASAGVGTTSHLACELFKSMAKVDITTCPTKATCPRSPTYWPARPRWCSPPCPPSCRT